MLWQVTHVWEVLGIVIKDKHVRSVEAIHLMSKHVCTFGVRVISYDKAAS